MIPFGTKVLVHGEVVRVIGKFGDDGETPIWRQTKGTHAGRYFEHDFRGATNWPGQPIPLEAEPGPAGYQLDPPAGSAAVRLRRLAYEVPRVGIVLGRARRQEGTVRPGGGAGVEGEAEPAYLDTGRTIVLYEVALQPASPVGKAHLVLVHDLDLVEVPQPVTVGAS